MKLEAEAARIARLEQEKVERLDEHRPGEVQAPVSHRAIADLEQRAEHVGDGAREALSPKQIFRFRTTYRSLVCG